MDCRLRDARRTKISIQSAGCTIVLVAIVLLTKLIFLCGDHHALVGCQSASASSSSSSPSCDQATSDDGNATDPLIYKRLRFDLYFMQIYRRYQKYLAIDERKWAIEVDQKLWNGATNKFDKVSKKRLDFYENDHVEATNFTYADLIFDALDCTYLTRLTPAYIYDYDNEQDARKASDSRLVSRSKCNSELSFLMKQLNELGRAREAPPAGQRQDDERRSFPIALNRELLHYFDTLPNEESAVLLGHYHWIDNNWQQCKGRRFVTLDDRGHSVKFTGRSCVASLRPSSWDAKVQERGQQLTRQDYFRYPSQVYNYKRYHRIQVAVCLPQSCDSQIISTRHADLHRLATFKLSQPVRSFNLVSLFCYPDETSELRQLEPAGKLLLLFAIFWLSLNALATYFDYKHSARLAARQLKIASSPPPPPTTADATRPAHHQQQQQQNRPTQLTVAQRIVVSFSLIRNFERLIETRSCQPLPPLSSRLETYLKGAGGNIGSANDREGQNTSKEQTTNNASAGFKLMPNDLLFFNFVKVFGIFMILVGHTGMQIKQSDSSALHYDWITRYQNGLLFSVIFYVDIFFVIAGFLTAYVMFVTSRVAKNSLIDWTYSVVHRYLRLAPVYVVMVWFCQSLYMHIWSGPLWDYGTSNMTFRSICRQESLWYPLTLTANFQPIHQECVMTAWYMSNDLQFYLVAIFILVLLHKSARLGWLLTCGAIFGCIALRILRYLTDPHARHLELMRPRADVFMRNNWDMHETYLLPHYRVSAYLIGLLAGHYTYMVLAGKWKSAIFVHPNERLLGKLESAVHKEQLRSRLKSAALKRFIVTMVGVVLMYIMTSAAYWVDVLYPSKWEPYAKYFATGVFGHCHAATGLASALIFTALMFGQWEPLRQFMSHPFWTLLSRINYALLVTQLDVINWVLQSRTVLVDSSNPLAFVAAIIQVVSLQYAIAVILTLAVEQPLAQLEQHFVAPIFRLYLKKVPPSAQAAAGAGSVAELPKTTSDDDQKEARRGRA